MDKHATSYDRHETTVLTTIIPTDCRFLLIRKEHDPHNDRSLYQTCRINYKADSEKMAILDCVAWLNSGGRKTGMSLKTCDITELDRITEDVTLTHVAEFSYDGTHYELYAYIDP